MFQPVIKWSGSKRSQSEEILKYFPSRIDTYYEPFCGGGSMLRALLDSNIPCRRYVASDLNSHLISLWNLIKEDPSAIYEHYERLWNELNKDTDLDRKRDFFGKIRQRLNDENDPKDFMFIMRTTTNGMPRYNSEGKFNNSFHITRNGIEPSNLLPILNEWSLKLREKNVEFINQSYECISPSKEDFVYLDPPYANTKGMYFGAIDNARLFDFLRKLKCSWVMSFDGISGDEDNTFSVPRDVYDEHVYIKSGNSSFKRVIGNKRDSIVFESLYIKGCTKNETKEEILF